MLGSRGRRIKPASRIRNLNEVPHGDRRRPPAPFTPRLPEPEYRTKQGRLIAEVPTEYKPGEVNPKPSSKVGEEDLHVVPIELQILPEACGRAYAGRWLRALVRDEVDDCVESVGHGEVPFRADKQIKER
jgi:hypothetical protein